MSKPLPQKVYVTGKTTAGDPVIYSVTSAGLAVMIKSQCKTPSGPESAIHAAQAGAEVGALKKAGAVLATKEDILSCRDAIKPEEKGRHPEPLFLTEAEYEASRKV